jgi:hypothetical protein
VADERVWICLLCRMEFTAYAAAAAHVRVIHDPALSAVTFVDELLYAARREVVPPTQFPVQDVPKPNLQEHGVKRWCFHCGQEFSSLGGLTGHLFTAHEVRAGVYGEDWYDPEWERREKEATVGRFVRKLTIVETVGDFLLECGTGFFARRPPEESV